LKSLEEFDAKHDIKPDKDPRSIINQILVEYGLLIALIVMILVLLLGNTGKEVNHLWSRINSSISVENR